MSSKCEAVDDLSVDCEQCGKRTLVFLQDPLRKFIDHLRLSRPFAAKIYFTQLSWIRRKFLLRRFLKLGWVLQLIMDCTKILSMSVENFHFLDSLNFIPMSLKSMPKSFELTCGKGYHFFNTANNLDYVSPYL
jgi:hypothetical protein